MDYDRILTPTLVATAAVVPRSGAGIPWNIAISAKLALGGSSHATDGTAAPSGASAISHHRRRHAFGHVIWADADALQARPPSNGRQVLPQPHQFPSHPLFPRSSRLTYVPR